jgi:hypothetical protein
VLLPLPMHHDMINWYLKTKEIHKRKTSKKYNKILKKHTVRGEYGTDIIRSTKGVYIENKWNRQNR